MSKAATEVVEAGREGQKAVVTGGAGFIGSHVADRLVELGYDVTVLDDLSTGRRENITHLSEHPSFRFVQGSILDKDLLRDLFRGTTFVFHQAAITSVPRSVQAPEATHEANATGALLALMAAREAGVAHFVMASSCAVYGDTLTLPKREDMSPHPQSPYAVSKLAAEAYCTVFTQLYGLPTTALRYFNVYGPRQNPDSEYAAVIPKFIRAALDGAHLTLYGSGQQSRDFIYVADVVEANLLAATRGLTGVYNVGSGGAVSIRALADMVLRAAGSDSTTIVEEPRAGDIMVSQADISHLAQHGYAPSTPLEKGIEQTSAAMRSPGVNGLTHDPKSGVSERDATSP